MTRRGWIATHVRRARRSRRRRRPGPGGHALRPHPRRRPRPGADHAGHARRGDLGRNPRTTGEGDALVGTWTGTALLSGGSPFDVRLDIASPCRLQEPCGTIYVSSTPCTGQVTLWTVVDGTYEFYVDDFTGDSSSGCYAGRGRVLRGGRQSDAPVHHRLLRHRGRPPQGRLTGTWNSVRDASSDVSPRGPAGSTLIDGTASRKSSHGHSHLPQLRPAAREGGRRLLRGPGHRLPGRCGVQRAVPAALRRHDAREPPAQARPGPQRHPPGRGQRAAAGGDGLRRSALRRDLPRRRAPGVVPQPGPRPGPGRRPPAPPAADRGGRDRRVAVGAALRQAQQQLPRPVRAHAAGALPRHPGRPAGDQGRRTAPRARDHLLARPTSRSSTSRASGPDCRRR